MVGYCEGEMILYCFASETKFKGKCYYINKNDDDYHDDDDDEIIGNSESEKFEL